MKVGVIGTGSMGKNHVRIYSDLRGVDELYITDMNEVLGKEIAKRHEANFVSSTKELLSAVDAVSICTPTTTHFDVAKEALDAGVNCLIEKPVAAMVEEGRKLSEIVREKDLVAGVGHIERFNPIIKEIKKILGKPRYIEIRRHNPGSGRITDTDVILDLMIHDVDVVFNELIKSEPKVIGAGGIKGKKLDMVTALFKAGSCLVDLSASRISSRKIREIIAEGEDKTLTGDFMTQELFVYKNASMGSSPTQYRQENIVEKVLVSKVEPLREELKTFLTSIKEKKGFPVSIEDGLNAMELCNKIREAVQ